MTFLIAVIANDFKNVPFRALALALLFLLALATFSWSGISPSCSALRLFASSLAVLFLLFFSGFFRGLFGLRALLGLVGLTL